MLRVSRLTDYATVVMTCIAAHPDDVLSTAQIADETRLELPTRTTCSARRRSPMRRAWNCPP